MENKDYEFHDIFTKSCKYKNNVAKCEKKRISKKCIDGVCQDVNLDKIPQKKDILHEHYIFQKNQNGSGLKNIVQKHKESIERVKTHRNRDDIKEKRERFINGLIDKQNVKKKEKKNEYENRPDIKEKKREYNKEYNKEYFNRPDIKEKQKKYYSRPDIKEKKKEKRKEAWKKEVAVKGLLKLQNIHDNNQNGSGDTVENINVVQKHKESIERVKKYRNRDDIKKKRQQLIKDLIQKEKKYESSEDFFKQEKEKRLVEIKERRKEYKNRPDIKEKIKKTKKEYENRPDIKEKLKEKRKEAWKKEVAIKGLLNLHNVNDNSQDGGSGPQFDGKKSSVMVKVPANVKKNAERAFVLRKLGFKGGKETGWKRAKQLSTKDEISIKDLRYIRAWFARHVYTSYPSYKKWKSSNNPKDKIWHNKHGIIAFYIWGSEAALKWVNSTKSLNLLNKYYPGKNYTKIKIPK